MAQGVSSREMYEILQGEIMSLQLAPGSTLRENDLCERFSVSRTPVRSVLQELRINGLVEVTPYKSTRITQLDPDAILQQIYLRTAVENAVLCDFCIRHTDDQLAVLRTRNDAMRRFAARPGLDPRQFYDMDSRLHEFWFHCMGKDHLWGIIQHAQNHYSRFRMLDLVEHNFAELVAEHDSLLDALEQRDIQTVNTLLHSHLYGAIARLQDRMPGKYSDYFVSGAVWPKSEQ